MFKFFKRKRGLINAEAPATTRFAPQQATFGLFGVYVRSLPSVSR